MHLNLEGFGKMIMTVLKYRCNLTDIFWAVVFVQVHQSWATRLRRGGSVRSREHQGLPTRLNGQGGDTESLLSGNQYHLRNVTKFTNITLVQNLSTPQGVLCSSCKECQMEASPNYTDGMGMQLLGRTQTKREKSKTA